MGKSLLFTTNIFINTKKLTIDTIIFKNRTKCFVRNIFINEKISTIDTIIYIKENKSIVSYKYSYNGKKNIVDTYIFIYY